jgi:hypothetical protein
MSDKLTLTCPVDGTEWTLVPGRLAAIQGHLSDVRMVRTPTEDVFGRVVAPPRERPSQHWISTGPDAPLTSEVRPIDEVHERVYYEWPCGDHGHEMTGPTTVRRVPCTRCGTEGAPRGYVMAGGRLGMRQLCSCCDGTGKHSADNVPCA